MFDILRYTSLSETKIPNTVPDLLTHTLFVLPLRYRYPKAILFILLGTILPDVLGRIAGVFMSGSTIVGWYQLSVHTPFSMILFIYALSFLFPQKERKNLPAGRRGVFAFLIMGTFIHFFLDFFQKQINIGNLWLFPLSFKTFSLPLIWPDETIFLIPILILINLSLFLFLKK